MQVRWAGVITLLLGISILVLLLRYGSDIRLFLSTMTDIGPGHSPEDKTVGFIAFGLALVGVLALVKILTHDRRQP